MASELGQLLKNIEECREKMITLATHSSMADDKVVEASTKLDTLLNKYFTLTSKENLY
ncbi:aspartyl-phosphate phosphatase Spo0E family protein [Peribacillus saganii]|uniref:Aspartyl-phosphate phosphatase Spo0E family protein n=1 Tax=Peribacillus saganii TaxID=2303992 RepID=A0A372LPI9_9BACI|nr:aspartyl-phosphate phosphatase Spo0E family protein [Peribacillus saganii]RFU69969.1 aspartyl-phosphate phosphatase Spo0E family protein [Peribacillus saganii]